MKNIHLSEKVNHKLGRRMMEDFSRRTNLFYFGLIHHYNSICNLKRFLLILSHKNRRYVYFIM